MDAKKKFDELLSKIKSGMAKPTDLNEKSIIIGESKVPVLLTPMTGEEREAYEDKKIHVDISNNYSKSYGKKQDKRDEETDILWNTADIEDKIVFFNDQGRLIVDSLPNTSTFWFIEDKDNQKTLGPYTIADMMEKMKSKELKDCKIKRGKDNKFISIAEVINNCPKLFEDDEKNIDKLFEKNNINVEVNVEKVIEQKKQPIKKNEPVDIKTVINNCTKSVDYLSKKTVKINILDIYKKIFNLTKNQAIRSINKMTGMSMIDSEIFMNLFIKESVIPVCSNVDEDGFESIGN